MFVYSITWRVSSCDQKTTCRERVYTFNNSGLIKSMWSYVKWRTGVSNWISVAVTVQGAGWHSVVYSAGNIVVYRLPYLCTYALYYNTTISACPLHDPGGFCFCGFLDNVPSTDFVFFIRNSNTVRSSQDFVKLGQPLSSGHSWEKRRWLDIQKIRVQFPGLNNENLY